MKAVVIGSGMAGLTSAAYLVRAVTPGTYTLPPVEVEAMYKPEYRARSGAGKVKVSRK